MADNEKISFAQEAQKHDWNFKEATNGFVNPESVLELANHMQTTVLGSGKRSLFRMRHIYPR